MDRELSQQFHPEVALITKPTATDAAADIAWTGTETAAATGGATDPTAGVAAAVAGLPPGALFFTGGVLALLSLTLLRVR